ncbi:MAG: hypothetical protein V3U30_02930 [Thermoplasmata archaeon]
MGFKEQLQAFRARHAPSFVFVVKARAVCEKCHAPSIEVELLEAVGRSGPLRAGARGKVRSIEVASISACPSCGRPK